MSVVYEYRFTRHRITDIGQQIKSPADSVPVFQSILQDCENEKMIVLALNTRNKIIGHEILYSGNVAGCSVRLGECFRFPIRVNAAAIIIAHNHPSGDSSPSGDDLRISKDMKDAGMLLDIEFLDHIILGEDGRWTSVRAMGFI